MRKSEIFENFSKIAQDKGLVSADKSFKALEANPRADSLSIKDIEILYGVQPDAPSDMKYKKNIMEIAHPTPAIAAPAYDRLNGLVENNIERQNILLNIVNRRNDGLSVQRKYAQKDLLLSLVRVANDMDNKDQEELRVLADACLKEASLKKEAAPWLIIGVVAAVIGGIYVQQHMDKVNEGFEKNHQYLTKKIDNLVNSSSSWGVGYDLDPQFKQVMGQFLEKLNQFHDLYEKIKPNIMYLQTPRTKEELIELAKSPKSDLLIKSYRTMRAMTESMLPYLQKIQSNFASETYKQMQIQDSGWMTELKDSAQILQGGKGLFGDMFDDVRRGIPAYIKSVNDLLSILKNADSVEGQAARDLQIAVTATESMMGSAPDFGSLDQTSPTYKPSTPTAATPQLGAPAVPSNLTADQILGR